MPLKTDVAKERWEAAPTSTGIDGTGWIIRNSKFGNGGNPSEKRTVIVDNKRRALIMSASPEMYECLIECMAHDLALKPEFRLPPMLFTRIEKALNSAEGR